MNYPLISEYVEAIKAAEDNFDQLKHLRPVLGEDGEPVMTSGNFAVVFKMKDEQTGKLHAVKCFLKEQEGRAEAYRQIAEELEFVSSTFLTPIKYLDKELFVDSANSEDSEFPVLLMDWVEGQTLDKYIREHIDDQYELSLLAYQFSRLAMWLMPQPFAHGDLKPDNILVKEDGTLVLVDYDGMYVPAMKGQKARELGSPDFRHPSRTEEVFDDHIDDFSLASILLSLKAIALQPSLLEEYGASDRLLFSERDYRNLSESSALGALQPLMQDAELASLYSLYILALSQNNLSQVSFRLFNLNRPDKSQFKEENLSTEVTEEDLANAWTDEYGVKYSADRKRLLKASDSFVKNIIIEEGSRVIGDRAFFGCEGLTSIHIPDSVTTIGSSAFECCSGLTTIHIPDSVTSIGKSAFFECCGLTSIHISDSVTTIEEWVFTGCRGLACIHLPDSVTTIGDNAFYGCSGLTSITIPDSITTIGVEVFDDCNNLTQIIIPIGTITKFKGLLPEYKDKLVEQDNNKQNWREYLDEVLNNAYYSSYDDHQNFWRDDDGVRYSPDKKRLLSIPYYLNEYSIREGTEIVFGRRNDDSMLSSIAIPSSVISIENYALCGCSCLSTIKLAEGLLKIGHAAFAGCGMQSILLPNSLKVIGESAFAECDKLESIVIPKGVVEIGESAFYVCESLATVFLPSSLEIIGNSAFSFCDSLERIIIPIGSKRKFEKLLPDYKNIFIEE